MNKKQGGATMKSNKANITKKCGKVLANLALSVTTANVNSACLWINGQPKLPKDAKKLRKF